MTVAATVLLGVAGGFAVADWVAVGADARHVEYWCKPAATAAFAATAATVRTPVGDTRLCFVVALGLCWVGDVCLMLPDGWRGHDWFVPGLGAFLLAQVGFAVGFALRGAPASSDLLGAVLVAIIAVPLGVRFVRALRRDGRSALVGPVLAYLLAIGAMATTAVGSADGWGIAGAGLFLASDALIAETRFVRAHRGAAVAIMVTYHLALAALVASLV